MAKKISLADIAGTVEDDVCAALVCDCDANNWRIFIYTSPPRVVIECIACGGVGESDIILPIED